MGGVKAYVRGAIIQYASARKKLEHNKMSVLEGQIKEAENNFKLRMNQANLRLLTQLKYQNNNILTQKVEFDLFRLRQKSFESGDKAGKMLARCIKHWESSASICAIRTPGRGLVTKAMDINAAFEDFYLNLYTSCSKK